MDPIKQYFEEVKAIVDQISPTAIQEAVDVLHEARLAGRKIFIMGNGGSAATASHFVCDLAKNTRSLNLPDFKVIGLADNMAIFSALANDEGYENVFAGQLASLVQPGDIVIGISTSGNSDNVLNAIRLANDQLATTVGFTGFDGGELARIVDLHIHVPSHSIEHVEDVHLMLEHLICKSLRDTAAEQISPAIRSKSVHSHPE